MRNYDIFVQRCVNKNSHIRTDCFIYYLLFFIFTPPMSINLMYSVSKYINTAKILAVVLLALYYLMVNKKISNIVLLVFAIQVPVLVSTFAQTKEYISVLSITLSRVSLCILTDMGINKNLFRFFRTLQRLLFLYILINLATIIMYPSPDGMFPSVSPKIWFIGYYNMQILYFIMIFVVSSVLSLYLTGRINITSRMALFLSVLTVLIIWSATSLTGVFIILLYMVLVYNRRLENIFNIRTYAMLVVTAFLAIIIFRVQDYFAFFIEDVLQRDLSFTGRVYIWDAYIKRIIGNPLFGNGLGDIYVYLGSVINTHWHAHDGYLQILYEGGFVSLGIYTILMVNITKKLMYYKNDNIAKVISIAVFAYMVVMLADECSEPFYYCLLVIAYNVDTIIKKRDSAHGFTSIIPVERKG